MTCLCCASAETCPIEKYADRTRLPLLATYAVALSDVRRLGLEVVIASLCPKCRGAFDICTDVDDTHAPRAS